MKTVLHLDPAVGAYNTPPDWWGGAGFPSPRTPPHSQYCGPRTSALRAEVSFASVEKNPGYGPDCVCVCVAIVVVTLWADNWRWHWSAGRRAVCRRVADRPRTGQLSTHHRRITDSPVWLSEPSAHRALRLSADHSCRHSQTEGNYSLYVVQFWKILLCLEITFEQKRHWNRLVQVSL